MSGKHVRPKIGNVGLTNMPDLRHLDLAFSKSKVLGCGSQRSPLQLDLAVSQVQGSACLENISDPRYLDLAVN